MGMLNKYFKSLTNLSGLYRAADTRKETTDMSSIVDVHPNVSPDDLPIDETMICIVGGYSWGVVGNKEDYLVRITSIYNSADSVTCTVDDIEEYVRSIPMCTKNYGEMFDVMRITTFIRFCIEDYVQFSLKNIAKYLSDK